MSKNIDGTFDTIFTGLSNELNERIEQLEAPNTLQELEVKPLYVERFEEIPLRDCMQMIKADWGNDFASEFKKKNNG